MLGSKNYYYCVDDEKSMAERFIQRKPIHESYALIQMCFLFISLYEFILSSYNYCKNMFNMWTIKTKVSSVSAVRGSNDKNIKYKTAS